MYNNNLIINARTYQNNMNEDIEQWQFLKNIDYFRKIT